MIKQLSILATVIVVIYALVDFILFPMYTRHAEEFDLADIAELSLEDAKKVLAENNLQLIVNDSSYSPIVEKNHIITQLPKAFSRVKTGRRVYVSISLGYKPAIVPELKGLSIKDAEFRLQGVGLEVREVLEAYSKRYPKNVVMGQSEEAGMEITVGDSISVTVSLGTNYKETPFPNYTEKLFRIASKDVQKFGLKVRREIEVGNSDYLPGTIVRQSIPVGTLLSDETEITFWVVQ